MCPAVKLLVIDSKGIEDVTLGFDSSGSCVSIHRQFLEMHEAINGWHDILDVAVLGFKLGECGLPSRALENMNQDSPWVIDFIFMHRSFRRVNGNSTSRLQEQGQVLVPQWCNEPIPPGEEITIVSHDGEFCVVLLHSSPSLELSR